MILYLLKFSACLLAFIAFYKVFLEQTSYNKFKRFYLISTLFIATCIPFITFTKYIEPQVVLGNFTAFHVMTETSQQNPIIEEPTNYLPIILWSIYGLGVLIFSVKFFRNLLQIVLKIKLNPKYKTSNFINVLLKDLVVPHTFFSYIFLNKEKFENNEIPREIILHEETHAQQKHSLDVLFIEVFQILFWFNPLIYLVKKDMKLNHEFLADQAVIQHGIQPVKYQELLLAFSSNATNPQLANAINYSSIKKRLTVMKTQTKKRTLWFRSLVLMPILALLVYSFSSRELVEKEIIPEISTEEAIKLNTNYTARSIEIKVLKNDIYLVDNMKANKNTLRDVVNTLHQDITPDIRHRILNIHVTSSEDISNKETWFIYNALLDYGFHRMVTPTQEIILSKGNTPFAISDKITGASSKELLKYNSLAKLYNKQPEASRTIPLNDLTQLEMVYKKMSKEQKENAQPFPNCAPENSIQKGASREQMNEYNKLAKHYNTMSKKDMRIKMKDVERMKYIYNLMSKKQRADAESFPDFPEPPKAPNAADIPPPPPVPADATRAEKVKYKEATEKYYKERKLKGRVIKDDVSNIPPPPPPVPKNATREQKEKYEKAHKEYAKKYRVVKGKVTENPPPPPPPKEPLDHVIDMAKKGAIFYLNEKKVTSDQAIDALKKNKSLNVQTIGHSSKQPTVYIQTKPIHIKNEKGLPKPTASNIIDHIKVMNRHNAKFYLNNTKITYNEALSYVRKNRNADVSTSTESNVVIIDKKEKQNTTPPKTGFINVNGEKLYYTNIDNTTTYYNRYGVVTDKEGKELKPGVQANASDILPNSHITKVYDNDEVVSEFKNNSSKISSNSTSKSNKNLVGILIKKDEKLLINGRQTHGKITLTKEELNNLKITSRVGEIVGYKIKFKGKKTLQIKENTLNNTAKSYLENLASGDMVQLFDIKDSNKTKNSPVIISIK